jgi:GH35 family endo-1,4-beta-xylanase
MVVLIVLAVQLAFAQTTAGLKDVYSSKFKFGSILNGTTANNSAMKTIVLREFNSITPENELKPDATIVASGSTDTDVKVQLNSGARAILQFCQDNNIPVRGHTFVWHSQTPEWFFKTGFTNSGTVVGKAVMKQRMGSYIKNMFALIKKDFPTLNLYAYDVVNEAASEDGTPRKAGSDAANGQSMWVQVYGDNSFIEEAFTFARQYAPATTKLFYNDYNEYIQKKRDYIANSIVKPLKDKGLIDGMGMQSHLDVRTGSDPYPSATLYGQAITTYKNLGVEVHVSELDATVNDGNESYFPAQATYYKNIMNEIITKGGTAVTAVVVWGIQDDQSWRKAKKPLLFDASGNKKAAYNELVKLIPESEWGKPNSSSSSATTPSSSSRASSSSVAVSSSSSTVASSSSSGTVSSSSVDTVSSSSTDTELSSSSDDETPILKNRVPITHFSIQTQSSKTLRIEISSPSVVEIYDLKGNKAASLNVSGSQTVKLSLPNGVYFAKAHGMRSLMFVLR